MALLGNLLRGRGVRPEARDDEFTIGENGETTVDPVGNDVTNHPLFLYQKTITSVDKGDFLGSVTITDDKRNLILDPGSAYDYLAEGETVTATLTYTMRNAWGTWDKAEITLTIVGQNDAPDAQDVTGSVLEDGTALIAADFTDPDANDSHSLSFSGATGSVIDNGDGTFTYDPDGAFEYLAEGETATDSFTYTVDDGNGGTSTATATVTITGENDDATISGDTTGDVEEDGTLTTGGTLAVTDPDHDQSAYQAVAPAALSGVYGDFTFDAATGVWTYGLRNGDANVNALTEGEQVTDTLTVTSLDGTASETITVTITGNNNAPTSSPVDLGAVDEDTPLLITQADLLANANDTDGDALTASDLQILTGNGAVMDNGDGTWSYTPALNDDTEVSFGYAISDGEEAIAAMASLDITPINDAPVAVDDDFTSDAFGTTVDTQQYRNAGLEGFGETDYNVTYFVQAFTAGAGPLDAVSFATQFQSETGSDPIEFRLLVTEVSGDGATLQPTTVLFESGTLTGAGPGDTGSVTTNVDLGGLTLVEGQRYALVFDLVSEFDGEPGGGQLAMTAGTDRIPGEGFYQSYANTGARETDFAAGLITYPDASVDIALTFEYGPPALTDEDTAITIDAADLLANDSDVDNDHGDLTIGSVSGTSALGAAVSLDGSGNVVYDPTGALDSLATGETATDSFTYTVSDGADNSDPVTVTFNVTGVNDAPSISGGPQTGTINESAPYINTASYSASGTFTFTDADVNDPVPSISFTPHAMGYVGTFETLYFPDTPGSFSWSLTVDESAIDGLDDHQSLVQTYDVTVDDGLGGTSTETVTVTINGHDEPMVLSGFAIGTDPEVGNSETNPFVSVDRVTNPSNGGHDYYQFDVAYDGTRVVIDLDHGFDEGVSFDSVVTLRNTSGAQIASNDDSPVDPGSVEYFGGGNTPDSYLNVTLDAGTYFIEVEDYYADIYVGSTYELQVSMNAVTLDFETPDIPSNSVDFPGTFSEDGMFLTGGGPSLAHADHPGLIAASGTQTLYTQNPHGGLIDLVHADGGDFDLQAVYLGILVGGGQGTHTVTISAYDDGVLVASHDITGTAGYLGEVDFGAQFGNAFDSVDRVVFEGAAPPAGSTNAGFWIDDLTVALV